jgi:hypothetical protein
MSDPERFPVSKKIWIAEFKREGNTLEKLFQYTATEAYIAGKMKKQKNLKQNNVSFVKSAFQLQWYASSGRTLTDALPGSLFNYSVSTWILYYINYIVKLTGLNKLNRY